MGIGGFIKKVGTNTLHDAEGVVDPRNYYRAAKMAVTNPIGFGESIGNSYLDLARHPIRSLEHPLTTTLSLLPAGKFADLGVAAGASRYANLMDRAAQSNVAGFVRAASHDRSIVPGVRAARMARAVGASEKTIWRDLKYRPGQGGAIEDTPGITTSRTMLAKLQKQLGDPNTKYFTDFATPTEQARGLGGAFLHAKQEAAALVHPTNLAAGDASQVVKSFLHEARHGYQKANWSRASRYMDLHRNYAKQLMEKDASAFADTHAPNYEGLISLDPNHPRIPEFAKPTIKQYEQIAKPGTHPRLGNANDFNEINGLINDIHGGSVGMPTEEEVLNHMDHLVATGQLTRDEAIQLQMRLADNPFDLASYSKPTSQNDLLRRSIGRARLSPQVREDLRGLKSGAVNLPRDMASTYADMYRQAFKPPVNAVVSRLRNR